MFYLVLLILLGLIYIFLLPEDIKKFMNVFVLVGGITLFITIMLGLVFRYHYSLFEILFYAIAIVLLVECLRELQGLDKKK